MAESIQGIHRKPRDNVALNQVIMSPFFHEFSNFLPKLYYCWREGLENPVQEIYPVRVLVHGLYDFGNFGFSSFLSFFLLCFRSIKECKQHFFWGNKRQRGYEEGHETIEHGFWQSVITPLYWFRILFFLYTVMFIYTWLFMLHCLYVGFSWKSLGRIIIERKFDTEHSLLSVTILHKQDCFRSSYFSRKS